MTDMTRILDLVRAGRLGEATDRIQQGLKAGTPSVEEPARELMRDISPKIGKLSYPKTGTGKSGKTVRAKPTSAPIDGTAWSRRNGAVPYRLFRPAQPEESAPLLVLLHGCTQSPEDFAVGTRMNAAAEAIGTHVVWPEQTRAANANGCWNWFDPAHQGRSGKAAAIVSIVQSVLAEIGAARRVFVAGLSAGGAMAAILGARYPEIFAGVGIHTGLPVGSAYDVASAFAAMRSGGGSTVRIQVPLIAFQGAADRTVDPHNITPFLPSGAKMMRATRTVGGRRSIVSRSNSGIPVEIWEVDGLGHAWSGGDRSGSYADPAGPDATVEMVRFFQETTKRA